MPVFLKRELTDQMPSLKKQNLRFEAYATKSVQDLFPKAAMDKAKMYEYNYCASVIALNNGKGDFSITKLPLYAELAAVNAVLCTDVNHDGRPDLIMGGNQFYYQPQLSRNDASFGHVLLNRGNGKFEWIYPAVSGLSLRGEIRSIVSIPGKTGNRILILQNNEKPVLYRDNHY